MSTFAPKVILIGERGLDIREIVKPTRLNPESPHTPIVVPVSLEVKGGMAENVYNNFRALGFKDNEMCFITNGTAIVKKRFIEEMTDATILRIDENDDVITKQHEYFKQEDYLKLKSVIENHKTVKAVIFSDYCKGFICEHWIELVAELCEKNGVLTIMDTKKKLHEYSRKIDFVKINTKEYNALKLNTQFYCKNLIVTRGDKGAEWVNKGLFFPTKSVTNPSVCGLGDSFLAAFTYKLIETNDPTESIKFANAAARVCAQKRGTATCTLEEITKDRGES
jgi:D-beta-D-heptose 7-phosphate kinase / D-beta-D-heptose 1-phosphate adenosyltransferase